MDVHFHSWNLMSTLDEEAEKHALEPLIHIQHAPQRTEPQVQTQKMNYSFIII